MKTHITMKTLINNKTKVLLGILMIAVGIGSNMAVDSIEVMADRRGESVSVPLSHDDDPLDEGPVTMRLKEGVDYKGFVTLTHKNIVTL